MSTVTDHTEDDERLMREIQGGNEVALRSLYERYRPLLDKIVSEVLANPADVDEALQDVFLEVWKRSANFDPARGKPLGWIIRMARRRAIDKYRKIRVRSAVSERLQQETELLSDLLADPSPTSSNVTLESQPDLRKLLLRILDNLPAEQGEIIRMSYFDYLSQREISRRTGIPLGTVKTRIVLALRKLAAKTAPYRSELAHCI